MNRSLTIFAILERGLILRFKYFFSLDHFLEGLAWRRYGKERRAVCGSLTYVYSTVSYISIFNGEKDVAWQAC